MKLLSFSGGSTKIAALAANGRNIAESGYTPDIVSGVSSGALVILPLLLGKHEELKQLTTHLKLDDIFDFNPVNTNGKLTISGYVRALFKGAFGRMGNLEKTINKIVSKEEYNTLMSNPKTPQVFIGLTNMTTSKFELININKLPYETTLACLIASCSIPMYTNPVKIGKNYYYDGGLKQHNPASAIITAYKTKITHCVSVYSRPKHNTTMDWGYNGESIGRNLSKTFDVLSLAVSEANQKSEVDLANLYHIKLAQHFSPSILKGVYDVDNERLTQLYNTIYKGAKK